MCACKRHINFLLLFMCLVCSTAPLASVDADDCFAVQHAKNFFNQHYSFFSEAEPQMIDQLHTAEFGAIISDHAECVGDNGICNLDFDPWLDAQDGYVDGEIKYIERALDENKAAVDLQYQFRVFPTLPAIQQTVTLLWNKGDAPGCWKLDDMLLPDGSSMKKMMLEDYLHFYFYKKTSLSWNLISSEFQSSKIAVKRDEQLIAEYELNCDVSESLRADSEQLDGETNKLGLVVTPSNPKGLLVTSYRAGAHSKRLTVYDLALKNIAPVWERIGSYYAQWSVNESYELVLSFDKPGNAQKGAAHYVREDVIWRAPEREY